MQPILQLLFPAADGTKEGKGAGGMHGDRQDQPLRETWANRHPFLNVSVNPIECSVVCSKALGQELFAPVISSVDRNCEPPWGRASISEEFVVIQVDGEGLEAGQRVLELTTPLAMAKM